MTEAHAQAAERLFHDHGIVGDIAVVGFHGQTVLHRPEAKLTVQLGDGKALARRLRLPVAFDFRAADVAAGGQGAPLVPVFHRALAENLDRPGPIAVLNLGGVANLTYIDGSEALIAFDTGPGNVMTVDCQAQGDSFVAGKPRPFGGTHTLADPEFEVALDGKRVIAMVSDEHGSVSGLVSRPNGAVPKGVCGTFRPACAGRPTAKYDSRTSNSIRQRRVFLTA